MPTYDNITLKLYNNSKNLLRFMLSNKSNNLTGYMFIIQVFELIVIINQYQKYGEGNVQSNWIGDFNNEYGMAIDDLRKIRNSLVHSMSSFESKAYTFDIDYMLNIILHLFKAIDFKISEEEKERIEFFISDYIKMRDYIKSNMDYDRTNVNSEPLSELKTINF